MSLIGGALLRLSGWCLAAWGLTSLLGGHYLAGIAFGVVSAALVGTARDMRYDRRARRLDKWAAEDIQVNRRRRLEP